MAQGGNDADDLAVSLTWANETAVVAEPVPPAAEVRPAPPTAPDPAPPPPRPRPTTPAPRPEQQARPAGPRKPPPRPAPAVSRAAPPPPAAAPHRAPPEGSSGPAEREDQVARPTPTPDGTAWAQPRRSRPTDERPPNEALLSILDHLSTLSRLVTGTSRASSAELDELGARIEKAVGDIDALQLRVLRSLAGFDALRLRIQKELSDRPPLTDEDVDRIADAVTTRLLDHVRVETEGGS